MIYQQQIQTYPPFPQYFDKCPECGGHLELVATIPKDNKSLYTVACFNCKNVYNSATTPEEAIENHMKGIQVERVEDKSGDN